MARRPSSNPKFNFIFTPFNDNNVAKSTNFFLNFGGGFHSNERAYSFRIRTKKFPATGAASLGARSRFFDRLDATFSYWRSYLTANWSLSATRAPSSPAARAGVTASRASFATIFCPGYPTISISPTPGQNLSMATKFRLRRGFLPSPVSPRATTPVFRHDCKCATSAGAMASKTAAS